MNYAELENAGFVRKRKHEDPVSLIKEYIKRDTSGMNLKNTEWLNTAFLKPFSIPGWDSFKIIRYVELQKTEIRNDTAVCKVFCHNASALLQDLHSFYIKPDSSIEICNFIIVRTDYGWRIDKPVIPHITSQTVLNLYNKKLTEQSRKYLKSSIKKNSNSR